MDQQFSQKYDNKDFVGVAINPGGIGAIQGKPGTDDMAGVQAYIENLNLQVLPAGLEVTSNYAPWVKDHPGANPFPVDIIVDKKGIVRYVAREYDAPTMHAIIEELIAEP